MAIFHYQPFQINIDPKPPEATKVKVGVGPGFLRNLGFNPPVEITTPSAFRQPPNEEPLQSILVCAHFDTGASLTNIDINLAEYLNLTPLGEYEQFTAGGPRKSPKFAIDLTFPNTNLKPFRNLEVGSAELPFNLDEAKKNPNNPRNIGVLIGRDIMSHWIVIWNGPTSIVDISD